MDPVFLEGEKVRLAAIDPDGDLSEYTSWIDDQDTTRYMGSGLFPATPADIRDYVLNLKQSTSGMLLGVYDKASEKHVGNVTLHMIDWVHRRGEIGILVGDPTARGKGLATEAVRLVVEHAFDRLGLNRLTAGYVDGNEGSRRLFEGLGFETEGRLREDFYLDGVYLDTFRLGLLRSDRERAVRG